MDFECLKNVTNNEVLPLITEFLKNQELSSLKNGCVTVNTTNQSKGIVKNEKYVILPGFCEAHAHFREPGFSYKETIKTGSLAGARGGYTTVCTMPNLNPVPDSVATLNKQLEIIKRDACIEVLPYGAITKGERGEELADLDEMSEFVCGFSDDGRGVQNGAMMESAMLKAKSLNKVIAAHCEDNSLLEGGYIHKGEYAKKRNHRGISSESEYRQIERDLILAKKTGVKYHVCHISTKESVELIRQAKKDGVDVTCETAPHYLVLTDNDLKESGNFKMNPPLRSPNDRDALIKGIIDGTIDMIATDHAPHSEEEKSRGLEKSPFGIVGLETSFAILYTKLVKENIISLEKLVDLMSYAPRKRFGINQNQGDFTVFEVGLPYKIDTSRFLSKGKSTPFEDYEVYGNCILTAKNGKIIYQI